MRKFEEVKKSSMKFPEVETKMPERSNMHSAGYDFYSKENFVIKPHSEHFTWLDVKAKMFYDNVLFVYTRSGNGVKKGITLKNNTGVIDPDYYNNIDNDGNIGICLVNNSEKDFEVKIGDRIAQGVFSRYLITDDDKYLIGGEEKRRVGGFGSTGK